jgi:hypothetical protein
VSDGSTLPLLRSSSVDEPPSPEVNDVQMSTPTWYEPEKDSEFVPPSRASTLPITLNSDGVWNYRDNHHEFGRREYDGDDEGQQQERTGTTPLAQESEFTISPAFLNAINRKLTRTGRSSNGRVLKPSLGSLPTLTHDRTSTCRTIWRDFDRGGMLDSSLPKPPPPSPSMSSPFYVQGPGQPSFVSNDDDMEIEML